MRRESIHQTGFQTFELWSGARTVEMRVAGAVHAWWHRDRLLSGLAWDVIAAAGLLRQAGAPRSVLMLGLAGGTSLRILRELLPDAQLTAVEIDPEIVAVARRAMHLDALGLEVVVADAYAWLACNRRRFDVVIDDIYTTGHADVFRPQAWTATTLQHLQRAIQPGGLLAVNLVRGAGHRKMQSATRQSITRHFPVVRSLTTPDCLNEVLVAGDAVLPASALHAYRDAFSHPRDRMYWDAICVRRLRP